MKAKGKEQEKHWKKTEGEFKTQFKEVEWIIKDKDGKIQKLEAKLKDGAAPKKKLFLGKYDEKKILDEIKMLLEENDEVKGIAWDLRKEIEYQK